MKVLILVCGLALVCSQVGASDPISEMMRWQNIKEALMTPEQRAAREKKWKEFQAKKEREAIPVEKQPVRVWTIDDKKIQGKLIKVWVDSFDEKGFPSGDYWLEKKKDGLVLRRNIADLTSSPDKKYVQRIAKEAKKKADKVATK